MSLASAAAELLRQLGVDGLFAEKLLPRAERLERFTAVVGQDGPELRMSLVAIQSPEWAALRLRSPLAAHVWTVMAAQADRTSGEARLYLSRVAQLTGAARSSVQQAVSILRAEGWLRQGVNWFVEHRRAVTRRIPLWHPCVPDTVATAEANALARVAKLQPGRGDELATHNAEGKVRLHKAIIPLPVLTSPTVQMAARSGHEFGVWLFLQAETWARAIQMTSRWIAERLHMLSSETRRLASGNTADLESSAKVRVALRGLKALGLILCEGQQWEPKTWSTPQTQTLGSTPPAPTVNVHDAFTERLLADWMAQIEHAGVLHRRRDLTPTAEERALAAQMVAALNPSADADPNAARADWFERWVDWLYAAWHRWTGEKPYLLTALCQKHRPEWLPDKV